MKSDNNKKIVLSSKQHAEILGILKTRFEKYPNRHKGILWDKILERFHISAEKLWLLYEMERTGGEPDVVGFDQKTHEYLFYDCCLETPLGRRNICYDGQAQKERERKGIHPKGNAVDMASAMGIEILTIGQYRDLQKLGVFDTKTSSWVKTPDDIRNLGGALFADRRYGHVFLYHNSAPSFYSTRAFRGLLRV
ncbi:MAG: DUF4256 domain-containing protein [Patescibacteria group bacterium]